MKSELFVFGQQNMLLITQITVVSNLISNPSPNLDLGLKTLDNVLTPNKQVLAMYYKKKSPHINQNHCRSQLTDEQLTSQLRVATTFGKANVNKLA